jgi:hypothetical protein
MLRTVSFLVICCSLLTTKLLAQADENSVETPAARIHRLKSKLQRAATRVRILLPDDVESDKRYRVLYVLPVEAGAKTRYGDGLAEARRLDLHNRFGLIVAAPDFADLPWYADHPTDQQLQQEKYFVQEVLKMVEDHYPVVSGREGRLLVGFSKSGWGAFSLLLRHPDLFEKAGVWDAPLMKAAPDQFGMGPIFGTPENFALYQLTTLARERKAELGDQPRLFHVGYGNFRSHHEDFERLLGELKTPHVYRDGPKRAHVWGSGWLEEVVQLMLGDEK